MIWVWGAVTAIALILEFVTTALVTIWFAAGGFVTLLVSIIFPSCPVIWQCVIFVAVSVILLILTRPIFKKLTKGEEVKTNLDLQIGKKFKINKISENGYAYHKVGDIDWKLVEDDGEPLKVGDFVEIVAIKGTKMIVNKIKEDRK